MILYAEAHPEEVTYLTARELGERCGVSESTVIRAVQGLGHGGYPEYQVQVRESLAGRRSTVERFAAARGRDPLSRAFGGDMENLRATWETLADGAFDRAAGMLAASSRAWLLGLRTAHAVALVLREGLSFLGIDTRLLLPGHGVLWDEVAAVGSGEVLVAVSLPRYTRLTVEAAELGRRRGARIISITDGPGSPLAPLSEVVLPVAYRLDGYVESFTPALCLAQALLLAVASQKGTQGLAVLKEKERLWAETDVYWRDRQPPEATDDAARRRT